ncbi:MAG: carbohydrate porin [Oscillatoriales cyanobacterium RM1_1_9]|nr:carbohydrate porin [Oscillatoriales cyanobacterium SM2_3_0]NJO45683.1 carbohydrate porin [Oscillatoriales cyanobacterium RM2_1_1]NJO70524.1 carbohydrate porin [Oscillatoriales cyanobacterium RM1_1_9]
MKFSLVLLVFPWFGSLIFTFYQPKILANDRQIITPVTELTDIQTTDWSFQALQSLVERYSCLSGFSNLFQGNSSLNRQEFVVILNACLNQVIQQQQLGQNISQADLQVLQRLSSEFSSELNSLQTNISSLESRITELESNQFSTTTKLEGETLLQFGDSFGDGNSQTFLGYRSRLNFNTSFTGQDLLRVRLESQDIARLDRVTGTSMARLGTDGDSDDEVGLEISYQFLVGDQTRIILGLQGMSPNDVGEILSPLSSSGRGAVSRFGRRDPATLRSPGGTGVGIQHEFNEYFRGNFGYFASGRDALDAELGFFNGSHSVLAQLIIEPTEELGVAITYNHAYHRSDQVNLLGSTGTRGANQPFGDRATASHRLGLQVNWEVISRLEIGGWFGYTKAIQQQNGDYEATILNGAITLALSDLLIDDSLVGIVVGIPPVVNDHEIEALVDQKTAWHIEGLYRFSINDFIEITSGVFVVINPDLEGTDAIWVGTVRTQFSF